MGQLNRAQTRSFIQMKHW